MKLRNQFSTAQWLKTVCKDALSQFYAARINFVSWSLYKSGVYCPTRDLVKLLIMHNAVQHLGR